MLSLLTVLLGPASMHELGLPLRVRWAYAGRLATNVWRHHVAGRLPGGRARLERRGRDVQLRDHATYLPDGGEDGLAELPSRDLPR